MITKEELELKLEPYWARLSVSRSVDTGEGWYELISDLVDDLAKIAPKFQVVQIKEKFGGLRFYVVGYILDYEGQTFYESLMYSRIAKAEQESFRVCEICGKPGEVRPGNWIHTLCDEDYAKIKKT